MFVVKLFVVFKSVTDMSYLLAIEYNVSPLFTMYVFSLFGVVGVIILLSGIFSCCPIDKLFVDKLFSVFNSFTVVLYLFAIE